MSYYTNAELKANRSAQDAILAERHRQWDLQAQDNTPKAHRHHWCVVGEGSKTANERFRKGYEAIDWRQ